MQYSELRPVLLQMARELVRLLEAPSTPTSILLGLAPPLQKVLAALTHEPQSSRRIARIARRKWNSHFRAQLRDLVTLGLARRISKGDSEHHRSPSRRSWYV